MTRLHLITTPEPALEQAIQLFRAYAEELAVDLCFQSFDAELSDPLKKYGPPKGALYIAYHDDQPAGCIALQWLEPGVCEMKRLFVHPAYREYGIGKLLIEALLQKAKEMQYQIMKLDTLDRLQAAINLYQRYGFVETTAYYANPLPGVVYMEKSL